MHRNAYQGRKFGRERDQRRALLKGLAESLIVYESIETTLPKAKELVSYVEKLITKAKKATLAAKREVISSLTTKDSAFKLIDELAPKLQSRNSGYLRVVKTKRRRGDYTQLAKVGFVFDEHTQAEKIKPAANAKQAAPANIKKTMKAKAK